MSAGQVRRFIVFGSFVTAKADPNDVDVFLLMEDSFSVIDLVGEARVLFDHAAAEACFGASIFWLRRQAAFSGEVTPQVARPAAWSGEGPAMERRRSRKLWPRLRAVAKSEVRMAEISAPAQER